MSSQTEASTENNTENKTISAEEIENTLDKLEEEENADFDKWFNDYVNEDKSVKPNNESNESNKPVESIQEEKPIESNEDIKEQEEKEVESIESNENQEDKPIESNEEIKSDENQEEKEDKSVEPVEPVEPVESNSVKADLINSAQDSTFTLSDIQGKKKVKQDVEITKHRKHRSRKTELSSSIPPKEPVVIQENEHARVEIGGKKSKKLSDEQLEKEISKAKTKITTSIQDQVEEMIANGNCKKLDLTDYTPGSDKYNHFKNYLLHSLLVPKRCITKFNLNDYIGSTTVFRYNCFDSPNVQMQHPIPEKVIFTEKLNKIFDYEFVSSKKGDFHFVDLDSQILQFISQHGKLGTLTFEYQMIKASLGKLILNLNTDVELALRDNTRPTLNSAFKQVIVRDIQYMKYIQEQTGKTYISWKAFLDTLLGLGSDKLIYVHDTYRNLNIKLEKAYSTDFLTENLLGNTLKCYLPSVALNYFYVVKSIYTIARLTSIYIQLRLFNGKSHETIMNDLYTIAVAGTLMYENKSFIYKQASRTLPSYDKPLSNETKLYILNHLLTGGQYYILKMIEESLPSISADLIAK